MPFAIDRHHASGTAPIGTSAEVAFSDGRCLRGHIFVAAGRPLVEALNGPGPFIEFEPFEGGTRAYIAKSAILAVRPIAVPDAPQLNTRSPIDFDPFAVLGLNRKSNREDVHAAFLRLTKLYHPDRFNGADIPSEVTEYLSTMAVRINVAYSTLCDTFKQQQVVAQPIYETGRARLPS